MIPRPSQPPGIAAEEVSALIEVLHKTEQRLEELTAGEVDTVTGGDGQTLLLRRAQEHLRHNEAAKQIAILNALPAHIALLDSQGVIISVNETWRRFGRTNALLSPGYEIGLDYIKICERALGGHSSEARSAAAGIRSVLDGRTTSYSLEYPCHSPTEQRWFQLTVTPLADDHLNGAVVMHLNITARKHGDEALRRIGAAMDAAADAFYLIDRASMRIVHVNDAACRLHRMTREELLAMDPWLAYSTSRAALEGVYDAIIASGTDSNPLLVPLHRNDGTQGWGELRRHAHRSSDHWTIVTWVRDVTERKLADAKLDKLARTRAVSSEINAAIVRMHDREALLREACRIAVEHGKFDMVWIGELDAAKREVRPIVWEGFSAQTALAVSWPAAHAPGVMLAEVLQTRRVVVRNDIEAARPSGNLKQEAARAGCHSSVCLPFVIDDTVVSAAILFAIGKGFFDDEEIALLNEVAANISFALAHMDKEEKLARLSRIQSVTSSINALIVRVRNRQELFAEACRIAIELGGFGIAWIGILDPKSLEVTPVAHAGFQTEASLVNFKSSASADHPLGRGVVGQAIRARAPVFIDDLPMEAAAGERRKEAIRRGYHSRIALPLLVSGNVIGVLVLYARERDFFSSEELKLLSELAGDISFALEHIDKETRLDYLAYYDVLTGLPNRTLLEERLNRQLRVAAENGTKVALLLADVQRFRYINESLGRHAGDTLLRECAVRLRNGWSDPDNVGRIAADCFGGIVADLKDETEIAHVPGKLVAQALVAPFLIENRELIVTMTGGIAVFPVDGKDADALFRNAEAALKRSKASGQRFLFYRPAMNARVAETLLLENKLRQALDREQFVLHYQPKLNLANGTISGLEALIRWNDPETGLVPPMQFIPLLEETGMIIEAGGWAMRRAVADHREWHTRGLQPPRIAVNVSSIQLRQKDFVDVVRTVLDGTVAGSHGLDLEITESVLMEDIEGSIEKLRAVRDMGVNIAIDDFGTGYSSLRYLAKLPVDALKIDRSFIVTMTTNTDSMTIVSTIISLAHSLRLKVIAEGVDAEEQRKFLRLLKCDEMQGYLFSRPVPKDAAQALLQANSTAPR